VLIDVFGEGVVDIEKAKIPEPVRQALAQAGQLMSDLGPEKSRSLLPESMKVLDSFTSVRAGAGDVASS
jgi:hypothetical protein